MATPARAPPSLVFGYCTVHLSLNARRSCRVDQARAASFVKRLPEPFGGMLSLLVAVGAHQAVKDPPQGDRRRRGVDGSRREIPRPPSVLIHEAAAMNIAARLDAGFALENARGSDLVLFLCAW